jgi:hypothetical protein
MTTEQHIRPSPPPRRSSDARGRHFLLHVLEGLLVVAIGVAIVYGAGQRANARDPGPRQRGPQYLLHDELTIKADLLEALPYDPQVIILSGSRGRRFDPRYIRRTTGHTAFNAAIQNGRPEEAFGLVNLAHHLFPDVRPRYLWLIHPKLLRSWWRVAPPLVLDRRFSRFFPPAFIAAQRTKMPDDPRAYIVKSKWPPPKFAADGRMVWSHADDLKNLESCLHSTVSQWFKRNGPGSPTIEPRSRHYFELTLKRMNDLGATPVLVMMPVHPEVLKEIGPGGFWASHDKLMRYLRSLRGTYRFILLDFTHIKSFHGDPDNFYDGYHPKLANTHRIIDEILRRYPHAFD